MMSQDTFRGILWMVLSMACFALEDVFIKAGARSMPTSQVLLIIGLAGGVAFAQICRRQNLPLMSRELTHWAMVTRTLCEIVGTSCFVTALVLLPMATPVAIFQSIPLVVTLGAALFMGAKVGWRRWLAILTGFGGVMVIVRPGAAGFEPATLLAVAATIVMSVRDLVTRQLPGTISSMQVAFYGFLGVAASGVVLMPFWGAFAVPSAAGALFLASAVLFGMIGYYALTTASRMGDIALITPFRYTRILFAICLGIIAFGERPDQWTLVGAALIFGSGVYTILRERAVGRRVAARAMTQPR